MRHQKKTPEEHARRDQRRQQLAVTPLIYPRSVAARMLSVSTATLIRLEKKGVLRPIKLDASSPAAPTFYSHQNLIAVANGQQNEESPAR